MKKNKKFVVCYIVMTLFLIFCVNIVMHLVLSAEKNQYEQLKIDSVVGYQVEGSQYIVASDDPQIYVRYEEDSIQGLRFKLEEPFSEDISVQVYYPDENKNYSEEASVIFMLPAAQTEIRLDIPEGRYGVLRLDINGNFKMKIIEGIFSKRAFLFSNIRVLLFSWSLCFVAAYLLCGILYHISGFRRRLSKGFDFFAECINLYITKARLLKSVCAFFVVLLAGICVEMAVSFIEVNHSFNLKEFYIICTVLLLAVTFIRGRRFYRGKIELMVGGILVLCGITFSLVMPVSLGMSWDDEIHYSKTISIARFNSDIQSVAEGRLPALYKNIIFDPTQYGREEQYYNDKLYNGLYQSGRYETIEKHTPAIKDLGYIPAIFGTWISWGLCLPFTGTIILTRIINVLFFAIMIYLSMKNVKSGKMLIAMFAFVPTVFFLASSFSYDTWLTVLFIYGFSRYFRELQHREEKLTWGRFLGIFIPLFLALGPKIVYAPILFLTAYMPKDKFKEKKWCYAYRACFIFAAAAMISVLCYVASGRYDMGVGDTRGGETVNAMQQLMYIKSNFSEFRITLITFLKDYFSYAKSADYLTFMAYMGINNMQWISISLLFFTALTDRISQDRKTIPLISKISAVIMYVIIGIICAVAMYIKFTPVGLTTINGCQGRYILPAVLPVLYMISRFGGKVIVRQKVKAEYYNMALIGVSVIFLMYNLWTNCAIKY